MMVSRSNRHTGRIANIRTSEGSMFPLSLRLKIAKAVLATEGLFHPRIFSLALNMTWPFLREADGMLPAYYGCLELRLDLREGAEREAFLHTYDPPLTRFIQQCCRDGDVVVDVGANVGQIAAIAADCVGTSGRVFVVEPNPSLAARLRGLADRNPLKNIRVLEMALGEEEGELPFYISCSHPYSTLDPNYLPSYPVARVVTVKMSTLDRLVSQHVGGNRIRLLKIDAQGYENRILRGAVSTLAKHPPEVIVLEAVSDGIQDTLESLARADL